MQRWVRLILCCGLMLGWVSLASAQTFVGTFGTAGEDQATHMAMDGKGAVYIVGATQGKIDAGGAPSTLLLGQDEGEHMGFVIKLSPDLSKVVFVTQFASNRFVPSRVVVDEQGIYLSGYAGSDDVERRLKTSILKLSTDGSSVLWSKQGPPNVESSIKTRDGEHTGYGFGITGLALDPMHRLYVTGSPNGRGKAGYVVRKDAAGEEAQFSDWHKGSSWALYLFSKTPGEPLYESLFYKYNEEDPRTTYTQGDCSIKPYNTRRGGQSVVVNGDTLIVTSDLQYDFNCGRTFPAFDAVISAWTLDGKLKWVTNMLKDMISEPDQAPVDIRWDAKHKRLYVAMWQHGSNNNRLPGDLKGDTGNIKVPWVGEIDVKDGKVTNAWYMHAPKQDSNGSWKEDGTITGWPKNSGTSIGAMTTDADGRVYIAGTGANTMFTTANALYDWPRDMWGGKPYVIVLSEDLKKVLYATVLRSADAMATGGGEITGIAVNANGIMIAGKTSQVEFMNDHRTGAPLNMAHGGKNDVFYARIAPAQLPFTISGDTTEPGGEDMGTMTDMGNTDMSSMDMGTTDMTSQDMGRGDMPVKLGDPNQPTPPATDASDGCGCGSTRGPVSAFPGVMLLVFLALVRRRRK